MAGLTTWSCERTDWSITSVSSGTSDTVTGASVSCQNCVAGCPDPEPPPPPPQACSVTPGVSYTETVTATVASGISVGAAGVESSLKASIGHANARTISTSVQCGTNALPACQKVSYAASLAIMKNVQTKMDHTYRWKVSTGHNSLKCTMPTDHIGPFPEVSYESAGMRTSTATGSSYGSAGCKTVSSSSCP
jgi:hypothetical protein